MESGNGGGSGERSAAGRQVASGGAREVSFNPDIRVICARYWIFEWRPRVAQSSEACLLMNLSSSLSSTPSINISFFPFIVSSLPSFSNPFTLLYFFLLYTLPLLVYKFKTFILRCDGYCIKNSRVFISSISLFQDLFLI